MMILKFIYIYFKVQFQVLILQLILV